jgi:type II secretion system protein I
MKSSKGFTLLEVLLALAILVGAMVALGELGRIGSKCVKITRDLTRAELLCESKMAEIVSGYTSPESVQQATIENADADDSSPWVYSIDVQTVDQGLLAVCVTVQHDSPTSPRPLSFSLTRWIPDPEATSSDSSNSSSTESTSP